MPWGIVTAELGCVDARGRSAIKEERVVASEMVADETTEFVEVDAAIGDDEPDLRRSRRTNAVAWLSGSRIDDEGLMEIAIDDQHWPRLCREQCTRRAGDIGLGRHHTGGPVADIEDAIGLLEKIRSRLSIGARRVGLAQCPSVFHVQADRSEVVAIHAAVHREFQAHALQIEGLGKRREGRVRLAIRLLPKEPNVEVCEVEPADNVAVILERLALARLADCLRIAANHARQGHDRR